MEQAALGALVVETSLRWRDLGLILIAEAPLFQSSSIVGHCMDCGDDITGFGRKAQLYIDVGPIRELVMQELDTSMYVAARGCLT